jgi:hypothetical protein
MQWMRVKPLAGLFVMIGLIHINATSFGRQAPDAAWEVRPKMNAVVELIPRTRIETWGELQDGVNFPFRRWRTGAILSRRLKPILKFPIPDIDQNKEHHLTFGAGYEYLHTIQNGSTKNENRIIGEVTPRILLAGLLFGDRNRTEFRWVNGAYDFRYRNKLVISRRFQTSAFRFTPYGSGELYYDRNHHSWNQSQYGFGVQFPYKNRLMLDTYVLHQNCTSCSQNPVNMLGTTLNFYFRNAH